MLLINCLCLPSIVRDDGDEFETVFKRHLKQFGCQTEVLLHANNALELNDLDISLNRICKMIVNRLFIPIIYLEDD